MSKAAKVSKASKGMLTRRELVALGSTAAVSLAPSVFARQTSLAQPQARPEQERGTSAVTRGRIKQSVCRWCYRDIPLHDFCAGVAALGLKAIDLLTPEEWPV